VSDDPPSPEESGPGLFGDPPASEKTRAGGYLVLARKYRPRTFEDLIGQDAMVRTIANSFALNRIPHAYMLTGVRGVGKTTTARLLARALNYESETVKAPSIALDPPGRHCQAIMESRHADVMEMDAASRTGIADIREILDGVRYAPVMARTKVYIIDEVHMLSTAAFNGLLKTLEEPPPHVKFVFATTEIRKVPVTVLSRCQRFDLKRIAPEHLGVHLAAICAKEQVKVDADGLALIARAAEGSVRDALSLLDQAIVQKPGEAATVTAAAIRDMLGLADRVRVADLFEHLADGAAKAAIVEVRSQYDSGADPGLILRDLLDVCHECARIQALGAEARIYGGPEWAARLKALASKQTPAQLSRLWQMLLTAAEEVARAPDPIAAAEMAMVRLAAAATLPPPEEIARMLKGAAPAPAGGQPAAKPPPPPGATAQAPTLPPLETFPQIVAFLGAAKQLDLQVTLERHVKPVSVAPGRIVIAPGPDAPPDLVRRLQSALERFTGEEWDVTAEAAALPGVESLSERRARDLAETIRQASAHPLVAEALAAFPGAAIVGVKKPPRLETDTGVGEYGASEDGAPRDTVTPFKREGSTP
jgi:DNA polymerase III subunit gamma/tau